MTHEEQSMWKVIRSHPYLWVRDYSSHNPTKVQEPPKICDAVRVREQWEVIRNIADGSGKASDLPIEQL